MATKTSASLTAAQQHELENIRASWAIEGQYVTDHEMRVLERVARGELDFVAAVALMNDQHAAASH